MFNYFVVVVIVDVNVVVVVAFFLTSITSNVALKRG